MATSRDHAPSFESSLTPELFRHVNDRINALADIYVDHADLELVCECESGCLEHLSVARDAYEWIRRFPTRFLVKRGHLAGDAGQVVETTLQYLVVEKG